MSADVKSTQSEFGPTERFLVFFLLALVVLAGISGVMPPSAQGWIYCLIMPIFLGVILAIIKLASKASRATLEAGKKLIELRNSDIAVMILEEEGTESWWQKGVRHRVDGPAVIRPNGIEEWWRHGELHRLDGPAVTYHTGKQVWYKRGLVHREGGPAIITETGTKMWHTYGKLNRTDGPAVEFANGNVQYWIGNRELSKSEFDMPLERSIAEILGKVL